MTDEDEPVTIRAGRQRTIIAALALAVGHPLHVEELIDYLWGDAPPATAVKTAQTYVARLRALLPEGWIGSATGGYELTIDPAGVDAWRFERGLADAQASLRTFDHRAAAAALEDCTRLWRGEPTDLGDQARGRAAAARLREMWLGAQDDLTDARLALGDAATLVADLEAAVRAEPLRERRWGQLMLALHRSNRQADALRAYQRARAELVDGLGLEPGAELRALERAIIADSPTLQLTSSRTSAPSSRALPAGVAVIASGRLAGRGRELAWLGEKWSGVVSGARLIVGVHGEPGIGKTRLAGELGRLAHEEGALVLYGSGEPGALTPYEALVDAIRPLVRQTDGRAVERLPRWAASELARLVPEIGDRADAAGMPDVDTASGRRRLFEAVVVLLDQVADGVPVVLLVDDLHWVDADGVALLRFLVRAMSNRLLLLATNRTGDPSSDRRWQELAARPPPEVEVAELEVGSLDLDAVAELTGGDSDAARSIHASTGGSPLYVTEVLRFRDASGRLPGPDEVPPGIQQVIAVRLSDLDDIARRMIEAAAVAGGGAAVVELAAAAQVPDRVALDAIEQTIAAHLLHEDPDSPGSVDFTHDLVRAAVLHEVSTVRRAHLHLRIATVLQGASVPDRGRAAEIAHHLGSAGGPRPDIARWHATAARHAMDQAAWEGASEHLEVALANLEPDDVGGRVRVLGDLGRAARGAGREDAAKRHYRSALDLVNRMGRPEDAARIVLAWTEIPVDVRHDLAPTIEILRRTLDALPRDSPLRAQVMGRLAYSMAWAGQSGATELADEAVALARQTTDPVSLARTLQFSTSSRDQFDAFDPAGIAGELHALIPHIEDPVLEAQAVQAWFVGCVQRRRRAEADRALGQLRAVAERHHLVEATFRAELAQAHLALADEELDTADRMAEELLAEADQSELQNLFLFAGALVFDVRRAQGRLAELVPWFDAVHASGEQIARVPAMRALALVESGRREEAREVLTTMTGDLTSTVAPAERPHSIAMLAEVAASLEDTRAAAVLRPQLVPWSGLVVYDGVNGPLEPVDRFIAGLPAPTSARRPA